MFLCLEYAKKTDSTMTEVRVDENDLMGIGTEDDVYAFCVCSEFIWERAREHVLASYTGIHISIPHYNGNGKVENKVVVATEN